LDRFPHVFGFILPNDFYPMHRVDIFELSLLRFVIVLVELLKKQAKPFS